MAVEDHGERLARLESQVSRVAEDVGALRAAMLGPPEAPGGFLARVACLEGRQRLLLVSVGALAAAGVGAGGVQVVDLVVALAGR